MERLDDDQSLFETFLGDGRPPLIALALGLMISGGTALFLAATGHFLPHDEQFLGMSAEQLCASHGCRVVHFMIHDRAAFGGVVLAIGVLYWWIVEFPLRERRAWAWWTLFLSGNAGFASFLAYIAFGYFDAWHAAATLLLLPCFGLGLVRSYSKLIEEKGIRSLLSPGSGPPWFQTAGIGRMLLLLVAAGITGAGAVILTVGMTSVFVPTDLEFMAVSVAELHALNPRLVPLIAHDRAGFGGALLSCGIAMFFCIWCGRPSRSLFQSLLLVGAIGFIPAIGVHLMIGYTDALHLAPAVCGALAFSIGLVLAARTRTDPDRRNVEYTS